MIKQRQLYQISIRIFLIIAIFIVYWLPVWAVGPGTGGSKVRVSDEKIGPYILLVATSPLPVTIDQQMSVMVRVTDRKTGQLRREAVVMVKASPREGGPILTAQATHKNAGNDYDYVAHFDIEKKGQWDITVSVEDELGQAEVTFTETATRGLSSKVLIGVAVPFVVLAVVVGAYLWRRSAATQ